MSVGQDIKEAYQEIGAHITIVRDSGEISGEYIDIIPNTQITKWFVREFFKECSFPYDSSGEAGDIVRLDTGNHFMVMNIDPVLFENEITEMAGVLYKCNVSGELQRPSGERDPQTYRETESFVPVASDVYAIQVEKLFEHGLIDDEDLGALDIERHSLYIASRHGVQLKDRYVSSSGEYYQVESVKKRHFPGVDFCELGEDHR